jgi:hypothetical protein
MKENLGGGLHFQTSICDRFCVIMPFFLFGWHIQVTFYDKVYLWNKSDF